MLRPRKFSYLAASTVEILHDDYGIIGYKQEAAGKTMSWNANQVVHIKLMEFNGEVRSFSGLKALTNDIAIMFMVKENLIAKLENGGSPDTIISIKGTMGVARGRFERLQTALESFSHLKKSHGNMPIDADVSVLPLGTSIKDMEYRDLAMFTISEFCLALGVPISRIPLLMTGSGGATNKGELAGNSDAPYEEKKNARRTRWENRLNQQFAKAGFTIRFRRTNLQDDIRETTATMNRSSALNTILSNLARAGKTLTIEAHLAYLSGKKADFSEEDIETLSEPATQPAVGLPAQAKDAAGNPPSQPQLESPAKTQLEAAKEATATNHGVSA